MQSLVRDVLGVIVVVVVLVVALTIALDLWGMVDVVGILRDMGRDGWSLIEALGG